MCSQCLTKAYGYDKPFIPGWYLVRATQDMYASDPKPGDWKKDQWGLVRQNDPDFIWTATPVLDPTFYMSDEELENMPPGLCDDFDDVVAEFEENFYSDPMTGYRLVSAMKEAGYDPDKHGYRVSHWLVHKLAEFIRDEKPHYYQEKQSGEQQGS